MKAIGYIRVSTVRQADEGVSIDAQREKIEQYCQYKGLDLTGFLGDLGKSGGNIDHRKGVDELIEMCENKTIDCVVVYKLDRLTRSICDFVYLLNDVFIKNNIQLHSISENFDTNSASGRLMVNILMTFAQFEREIISERTAMAWKHMRSVGRKTAGLMPVGYDKDENGNLVKNENYACIEHATRLYKEGASYRKIALLLFDLGFTNSKGQTYSPSVVKRMIEGIKYENGE